MSKGFAQCLNPVTISEGSEPVSFAPHGKRSNQSARVPHTAANWSEHRLRQGPHSPLWVSRTGNASDWCALQEALDKCIDTIQYNTINVRLNRVPC